MFPLIAKMERFTLLVNGKDIDTGIYDYLLYIDKVITDFHVTRKIIKELEEGKMPKAVDEYIYAKYCLNKEDTNKMAIGSAAKAFRVFRKFSLSARKKIFYDMYNLLIKKKKEIIDLLIIEGHPLKLAEWEFEGMEMGGRPETIDFFCKHLQREIGRSQREILYWARRPDGVVCLSPPSNAAASNSYLAAYVFLVGNTLIIKPPIKYPISTIFLWKEVVNKALVANNAPPGTLNIILGNSQAIMNEWLLSPLVNDIIFFGDSNKGLEFGAKIFAAGKKPILELSGNDFLIVWKDADLDKAAISLLDGFLGSTQICMVPKIAIIHKDVYEKFASRFTERVKKLKIALPSDPETILSPVGRISEFFDFLNDALGKGAKLICGGKRVNHYDIEDETGRFIRPTLIQIDDYQRALEMKCLKEEIFFPLLPLIRISGRNDDEIFEKIIYIINTHGYGLRISLWIKSATYLRKFAKDIDNCGLFRINSRHVGFSPFLSSHGGTKKSGGPFGEMNYIWQKTSHLQGVTRAI